MISEEMEETLATRMTKGAKGGGTIRQRPDGRWEARYTLGIDPGTGKQIQKSVYGKTQKEVRQKLTAITAEIAINTTMKIRMINTCFFSVISFTIVPRIISSVSVEEDASTSDDNVDMDAESTRITTTAIKNGDSFSIIAGIIAS